ncbi:hypothetical protein L7D48_10995 [Streptomyces sp. S1A]|uniref:hypothetical protein n=1 Tax=Streptomyces sp. ICN903 TaxID=2964654 RepID=UPI001EDC0BFB|nr:hypothetical protein [Streptomyces sp. ICN903]MCG3041080.1 hypothetical protein [Streptomyces sp. ICN903]
MSEADVGEWFRQTIVETGRLPLFCFFTGMIAGFASIRFSTRMIRAGVRRWPGNVEPGGLHIHHVVFGVVMMLLGGTVGFAVPAGLTGWRAAAAALFGVGSALVLDEFALILRLRDVYWTQEGRLSVEAVFVALAALGLLLIGERPVFVSDIGDAVGEGGAEWAVGSGLAVFNFGLVAVTLFKGKFWTGFLGLFFPVLLVVSAVRLSRPDAPWARWRYRGPGGRRARKLERAVRRERRLREPVMRMWDRLSDLVAGRPDAPAPPRAARDGPRRPGDAPPLSSRTASRGPRRR